MPISRVVSIEIPYVLHVGPSSRVAARPSPACRSVESSVLKFPMLCMSPRPRGAGARAGENPPKLLKKVSLDATKPPQLLLPLVPPPSSDRPALSTTCNSNFP